MVERHLRQAPATYGLPRSRWRLADLHQYCPPLQRLTTLSGVWRRLRRYRFGYKRSRDYLHSPDPQYEAKLAAIAEALRLARQAPTRETVLYGDEVTCYRQPLGGPAFWARGSRTQPLARRSYRANTQHRVIGALNALTGEVTRGCSAHAGVRELGRFLGRLRAQYGARRVVLIWDNWPVHRHPTVLAAAAAQHIELLWLPTYAPWCNPIEKLWRKLKQELLYLHPHSDCWPALKDAVASFLDQFAGPSPALLRYVGLPI